SRSCEGIPAPAFNHGIQGASKDQGGNALSLERGKIMQHNKSKVMTVALVMAMVLGAPALAKPRHGGKAKHLASLSTCDLKAEPGHAVNPIQRAPTFAAPNPNSPALLGDGGPGYNVNFYVY